MRRIKRNENCPCRSGKRSIACCMRSNYVLVKEPVTISPPAPKSNYSHPQCFLSSSSDCSEKISREHYLSESVLKAYSPNGKSINVKGVHWKPKNIFTSVPIDSLVVKGLCRRHNAALSSLDNVVKILAEELRSIDSGFNTKGYQGTHLLLAGEDIERWILKTVVGMSLSKNIRHDGLPANLPENINLSGIILGNADFPEGTGLHCRVNHGKNTYLNNSLSVSPNVIQETQELHSVDLSIGGCSFLLLLQPISNLASLGIRRPRYIEMGYDAGSAISLIELCWRDGSHGTVRMTRSNFS